MISMQFGRKSWPVMLPAISLPLITNMGRLYHYMNKVCPKCLDPGPSRSTKIDYLSIYFHISSGTHCEFKNIVQNLPICPFIFTSRAGHIVNLKILYKN